MSFFNKCLLTGSVPATLKVATVTPLLKKPSLDPSILNNFRPISVLPFISKVLEKIVFDQLQFFLNRNSISEIFQSGFKSNLLNDILLATDSGDSVVLVLLDLSAAFDTVDQSDVGLKGTVLKWFQSFLSDRIFFVKLDNFSSSVAHLTCGIPQGSILAPFLFSLYMVPLGSILRRHGVSFHFYANDTQIYLPIMRNDPSALSTLRRCLDEVKSG